MLIVVIHNKPQCIKRHLSSSSFQDTVLEINNNEYGSSYQNLQFHTQIKMSYSPEASVGYITDSFLHGEL